MVLVVSTERLILWRSEIFGGISNEIAVILDGSTLPADMKGFAFGFQSQFVCSKIFPLQQKATWQGEMKTQMLLWYWETQHTIGRRIRRLWGSGFLFLRKKMDRNKRY